MLNAISNYSESRSTLKSKGRNMLLDNFIEGEFSKVREIKNYLVKEVENDDYAAFYPSEYWLLLYWTQDYNELGETGLRQMCFSLKFPWDR